MEINEKEFWKQSYEEVNNNKEASYVKFCVPPIKSIENFKYCTPVENVHILGIMEACILILTMQDRIKELFKEHEELKDLVKILRPLLRNKKTVKLDGED